MNGGFDPVSIGAAVGDTLEVTITGPSLATTIHAVLRVDGSRHPRIVRTNPPSGGRDVPLNATVVVVFSEPIDSATVSSGTVQLLRDTAHVSGAVGLTADQLRAALQPTDTLASLTTYTLVVTQAVRDVNGNTLDSTVHVSFTTGTAPAAPAVSLMVSGLQRTDSTIAQSCTTTVTGGPRSGSRRSSRCGGPPATTSSRGRNPWGVDGVWGISGTDVFTVGQAGAIWHYDGTRWSEQTRGATTFLWSVWGPSPPAASR